MPDYYSILWRALKTGDFDDALWRRRVFDRTRQMLLDQLRVRRPPLSNTEIRLQTDALEAAIRTIQSEFAPNGGGARAAARHKSRDETGAPPRDDPVGEAIAGAAPRAAPFRLNGVAWVAVAVVVAAMAAGVYAYQATRPNKEGPVAEKIETAGKRTTPTAPERKPKVSAAADGDLAPGIDGGSTDADVPFFYRRQPVFYRTTHPVGTVIVDKPQHFLYIIQPNLVALRYGIGIGKPCADVAGLRRVASMVEWPQWQAPAETVKGKLVSPAVLPGGPGNPLGARLIGLDDGSSRIHGTNAPKTIGSTLNSGCIRLLNDDVVDLYNRVSIGTRVVLSD